MDYEHRKESRSKVKSKKEFEIEKWFFIEYNNDNYEGYSNNNNNSSKTRVIIRTIIMIAVTTTATK